MGGNFGENISRNYFPNVWLTATKHGEVYWTRKGLNTCRTYVIWNTKSSLDSDGEDNTKERFCGRLCEIFIMSGGESYCSMDPIENVDLGIQYQAAIYGFGMKSLGIASGMDKICGSWGHRLNY